MINQIQSKTMSRSNDPHQQNQEVFQDLHSSKENMVQSLREESGRLRQQVDNLRRENQQLLIQLESTNLRSSNGQSSVYNIQSNAKENNLQNRISKQDEEIARLLSLLNTSQSIQNPKQSIRLNNSTIEQYMREAEDWQNLYQGLLAKTNQNSNFSQTTTSKQYQESQIQIQDMERDILVLIEELKYYKDLANRESIHHSRNQQTQNEKSELEIDMTIQKNKVLYLESDLVQVKKRESQLMKDVETLNREIQSIRQIELMSQNEIMEMNENYDILQKQNIILREENNYLKLQVEPPKNKNQISLEQEIFIKDMKIKEIEMRVEIIQNENDLLLRQLKQQYQNSDNKNAQEYEHRIQALVNEVSILRKPAEQVRLTVQPERNNSLYQNSVNQNPIILQKTPIAQPKQDILSILGKSNSQQVLPTQAITNHPNHQVLQYRQQNIAPPQPSRQMLSVQNPQTQSQQLNLLSSQHMRQNPQQQMPQNEYQLQNLVQPPQMKSSPPQMKSSLAQMKSSQDFLLMNQQQQQNMVSPLPYRQNQQFINPKNQLQQQLNMLQSKPQRSNQQLISPSNQSQQFYMVSPQAQRPNLQLTNSQNLSQQQNIISPQTTQRQNLMNTNPQNQSQQLNVNTLQPQRPYSQPVFPQNQQLLQNKQNLQVMIPQNQSQMLNIVPPSTQNQQMINSQDQLQVMRPVQNLPAGSRAPQQNVNKHHHNHLFEDHGQTQAKRPIMLH